jgi:hypothetical protein
MVRSRPTCPECRSKESCDGDRSLVPKNFPPSRQPFGEKGWQMQALGVPGGSSLSVIRLAVHDRQRQSRDGIQAPSRLAEGVAHAGPACQI